jgi:hypothetical protein
VLDGLNDDFGGSVPGDTQINQTAAAGLFINFLKSPVVNGYILVLDAMAI